MVNDNLWHDRKAVLFDMDGVLFDSMPLHARCWTEALRHFGLHMTPEEVYMNEGRTGAGTINALTQRQWQRDATPDECEQIYDYKSQLFNALPRPLPMKGAADVLYKVRARGLQRVLVTGSGQKSLLARLEEAFPGQFTPSLMVTAFDVRRGKPDPEPYLMGLQKAGLRADEAVVVENAPLGVEAGHKAGIFTIAVNTGPLPDSILREAGADLVLPSMQALAELL